MKINKKVISKFYPCNDRFNNYLKYYKDFDGLIDDFLDLENISYDDKIWVSKRLLTKNQAFHWDILCAESVLSIYENKYPNDKRIGDCLNYMKTIIDFSNLTNDQIEKLSELRYAASNAAYAAAAYSAAGRKMQQNHNLQLLKVCFNL